MAPSQCRSGIERIGAVGPLWAIASTMVHLQQRPSRARARSKQHGLQSTDTRQLFGQVPKPPRSRLVTSRCRQRDGDRITLEIEEPGGCIVTGLRGIRSRRRAESGQGSVCRILRSDPLGKLLSARAQRGVLRLAGSARLQIRTGVSGCAAVRSNVMLLADAPPGIGLRKQASCQVRDFEHTLKHGRLSTERRPDLHAPGR